jgi:hypothetical protein
MVTHTTQIEGRIPNCATGHVRNMSWVGLLGVRAQAETEIYHHLRRAFYGSESLRAVPREVGIWAEGADVSGDNGIEGKE